MVLGAIIVTALLPALVMLALLVDVVRFATRRVPFMTVRMLGVALGLPHRRGDRDHGLRARMAARAGARAGASGWSRAPGTSSRAWAGSIIGATRLLLGLSVHVEGDDVVEPGPVIVMVRHASILDNLLPSVFVARPHKIRLRYLLKRELLSDPGLDIGGKRLPNYFVRRGTGAEIERENVRRLAEGMGADEGMLIFPEGTRFTEERRAREVAKITERDPALAARAEQIHHLLPPKVGGVLAILDGAPDADVLVVGHTGFDGLRRMSEIWDGVLVGREIRVRIRRIPRADVPPTPTAAWRGCSTPGRSSTAGSARSSARRAHTTTA